MCKLFIMTNMSKIDDTETVVNTIANLITVDDRDGFGYAIQGKKGLYGERTNDTVDFNYSFHREIPNVPFIRPLGYNRFGELSQNDGAGIFHGRYSTNSKDLINVHPINKNGWSLIHNGVVSNKGPSYPMMTQNDTEHLLHYISTTGVKGIEENLTGYYAIAAFDPQGQLHILRDSIAPLYFAKLADLDSYVFATTKTLIESVCGELGWKHSIIGEVSDNVYLIYKNNIVVHSSYIKPRGTTENEARLSSLSLGYDLTTGRYDDYLHDEKPKSKKKHKKNQHVETEDLASLYSEDEMLFLEEVNSADASYCFFDYHKEPLTLEEFRNLDNNEKLYCTVVRGDGTIVDSFDYGRERLWDGSM